MRLSWFRVAELVTVGLTALALVGCIKFGKDDEDDDGDYEDVGDGGDVTQPGDGWSEPIWCEDMADLSSVAASFDSSDLHAAAIGISELRYPPGVGFMEAQSASELALWLDGGPTFERVLDRYEVAVHEGCHIWGFGQFSFSSYAYRVVDDDLIIETAYLDNFPRSEILDRHYDPAGDFYANVYLTGASGDQGFNTLLDEFNAYAHSLASRYCTRDTIAGSTSARDGILTFMYYVETYLKIAREDHPGDYDAIVADAPTVDLILTVWDRAEFWLDVTANSPELGIDDDAIEAEVYRPENLDEIDRLR